MRQQARWKRYIAAPVAAAIGIAGLVVVRAELSSAAAGDISTYVSNTDAFGVAVDAGGSVFFSESGGVRVSTGAGSSSLFAGNGVPGVGGDGGSATFAQLMQPTDIGFDGAGNVYILDEGFGAQNVRKVDRASNVISTVLTSANLGGSPPTAMAVDAGGNVFVSTANVVAKFAPGSSDGQVVAGTGNVGNKGDGGLAVLATFDGISGLLVSPAGDLFISDGNNNRVRKVSGGVVSAFAGCLKCLATPSQGVGDGKAAVSAPLRGPEGMALAPDGSLFIADVLQFRVRKVDPGGVISTVAGTGSDGSSGDGGPATSALLDEPRSVALSLVSGNLFIGDTSGSARRVRVVESVIGGSGPSTTTTTGPGGTTTTTTGGGTPGSGRFVGLNPVRVLDTRPGENRGVRPGKLGPGESVALRVVGSGTPVPAGVGTVVLNLTATEASATSYVAAWPTGEAQPFVSSLNLRPGETRANLVIAKVGAGGQVSLFNAAGSVHLIGDIVGYYESGAKYVSLSPQRVFDTRGGVGVPAGKVGSQAAIAVQVTGVASVPGDAAAVVVNLTGVNASTGTFVSALPTWAPGQVPGTSSINLVPGELAANLTLAKVGPDGKIRVYNGAGTTDVVGDVVGYFPAGTDYVALSPQRLLDTRSGLGAPKRQVPGGSSVNLQVLGRGGVPSDAAVVGAVVLNVTVVNPSQPAFITVWPTGDPMPLASSTNVVKGQVVANTVIAKVGANGSVSLYNSDGNLDLLADVVGWIPK